MNYEEATRVTEENTSHFQYVYTEDSKGNPRPCGCAVTIVLGGNWQNPNVRHGWSIISLDDEVDPKWPFTKSEARRLAVERAMSTEDDQFETARQIGRHKGSVMLLEALRQTRGKACFTAYGKARQR